MQAEGKSWRGRDRWLYAATVLHGYGNVCAVGAICAMIRAYSNCRCPAHGEVAAWTAAKPSKPSGRSHLRRGFRGNERVGRLPHGKLPRPWCERAAQASRPQTDVTAAQPRQREVEGCRPRHRQNEQEDARGCRDGGTRRPRGVGKVPFGVSADTMPMGVSLRVIHEKFGTPSFVGPIGPCGDRQCAHYDHRCFTETFSGAHGRRSTSITT